MFYICYNKRVIREGLQKVVNGKKMKITLNEMVKIFELEVIAKSESTRKTKKSLEYTQPLINFLKENNRGNKKIQVQLSEHVNKQGQKYLHINIGRIFEAVMNFISNNQLEFESGFGVDLINHKSHYASLELKACVSSDRGTNELTTKNGMLFYTPKGIYYIDKKTVNATFKEYGNTRLKYTYAYKYGTKDNKIASFYNGILGL